MPPGRRPYARARRPDVTSRSRAAKGPPVRGPPAGRDDRQDGPVHPPGRRRGTVAVRSAAPRYAATGPRYALAPGGRPRLHGLGFRDCARPVDPRATRPPARSPTPQERSSDEGHHRRRRRWRRVVCRATAPARRVGRDRLVDRGPYVSFANCGLPYYVGGVIEHDRACSWRTRALPPSGSTSSAARAARRSGSTAEGTINVRDLRTTGAVTTGPTTSWSCRPAPLRSGRPARASTCRESSWSAPSPTSHAIREWIEGHVADLAGIERVHRDSRPSAREARGRRRRRLHRPGDGREPRPSRPRRHRGRARPTAHVADGPGDGRATSSATSPATVSGSPSTRT